ncbi:extracellular solute-binding protein [Micromonospora cathayae]|uniref:Extracellular solute-binding protein n=1 Tax=Micromonospora cathayae TaxID=3028804 RepID=A0ABY7ZTP6_9ACTN|nr:extracellular solute-binding protein [Micromonospora sp. HUAS 3]WDZ85863.1 extracellular solute-binding protein [Micromonospora sp. HUAS 3]
MTGPSRRRHLAAVAVMALAVAAGTACSPSADDPGGDDSYLVWDPYPQFADDSAWVALLRRCGSATGVTVERTGHDTTDLTNKALLAAQQGNSPDVLIVDNPVVSTLAEAGVLTTTDDNELDVSAMAANLLGAGQSGGSTYGVPIGANTLALYYNRDLLSAAGVDPATISGRPAVRR